MTLMQWRAVAVKGSEVSISKGSPIRFFDTKNDIEKRAFPLFIATFLCRENFASTV
jgi:hypothetical protein